MGWMEVLAMLKRIAPLLNRLAPMLEAFLAGRAGGRADAQAMERLSGDIQGQLTASGEQQANLIDALRTQAAHLADLTTQLERVQMDGRATEAQLAALQASFSMLKRLLLLVGTGLLLLTAASLGLLLLILHRLR